VAIAGQQVLTVFKRLPMNIALLLIKFYRMAISPLFPGCCRFTPTCSEYGLIALQRYGFLKGSYLTIRRILRCRPGGGKGYDPVP
jgi:putative membrane protein insertion efficiency factor